MAYATLEDVRGKIPQIRIDATSRPNEVDVQEILDYTETSLDVMLQNLGYSVPVNSATSPRSVRILRDIVASEVASQTIKAQVAGVRNPDDLGAKVLHDTYIEHIKQLIDPKHPFALPDAEASNVDTKVEGDVSSLGMSAGFNEESTITRNQIF